MSPSEPPAPPAQGPATWAVWRQDDNGNRFLVERHLRREDALALAAALEARGHKQYYTAVPEKE